jgi:hypothetical protein
VLDYGVHTFRFGVSGPPVPDTAGIPNVKYEFVRLGGGFRVGIGKEERFIIATNIAFRGVFNAGSIATSLWFPEAKVKYKTKRPKEDRPAAVDIEVDFRLVRRNFGYNDVLVLPDDPRGDLRDYRLDIGPGVGMKFQYFPGAHFTAGAGAQFGIDFEWERLFNFDSTRDDGVKFPTESQQFLVGLRWRYPTGRWEPTVVLDYGVHTFRFGVSGPPVPETAGIPNVRYEFVRLGGGFRVGIGKEERFIIATNIAFRGVFNAGSIATSLWFPEAKVNGMDAMLMLGYALPKGFEIRIGFDYRRYWFDLNPVAPDAPWVAGGALDQYLGFSIGVAWRR